MSYIFSSLSETTLRSCMLFRMWYGLGMLVRHRTFGSIPYIGEGGVKGGSGGEARGKDRDSLF